MRKGAIFQAPVLALFCWSGLFACQNQAPPVAASPDRQPELATELAPLQWAPLDATAFERARTEGKLILVDAGIEGCTACRHQHEITYRHPEVVRRLREDYVLVAVDADQQPDLGHQFRRWGWPATIFLNEKGQIVHAVAGSRMPPRFLQVLDEVEDNADERASRPPTTGAADTASLRQRCASSYRKLDRIADPGGWGGGMRFVASEPLEYAIFRAQRYGEESRLERVEAAAEGFRKMLDPVWGGVFVAARNKDYTGLIPEKRVIHEAGALWTFAAMFALTGEEKWKTAASEIDRYLVEFLQAPDGTFYSTQQDEPPDGLPRDMEALDYFALDDASRRKLGVPRVDTVSYSNENGRVIFAYLKLFQATGDPDALHKAETAAQSILTGRSIAGGAVAQTHPQAKSDERRMRAPTDRDANRLFLGANARMGRALLELYQATGSDEYLQRARQMAEAILELEDSKDTGELGPAHGFFSTTARKTDAYLNRTKPLRANLTAARLFVELSAFGESDEDKARLRQIASRTLHYATGRRVNPLRGSGTIALTALALDAYMVGTTDVSIVTTDPEHPMTQELVRRAFRAKAPLQMVKIEAPGRYPAEKDPVAYICTESECSAPLRTPENLEKALKAFLPAPEEGLCRIINSSIDTAP